MKRTPEQAQAAVEEVKVMLKNDPNLTVEEALKKKKLQPSTWYKYKNKRKPYTKKTPTVSVVMPLHGTDLIDTTGGARRWTVITNDPEVIEKLLSRLS